MRPPAKSLSLSAEGVVAPTAEGQSPTVADAYDEAVEKNRGALPYSGKSVAFVFGPENGAISEKLVHEALKETALKRYTHLYVIGFATISLLGAPQLASGSQLARLLAGFIAIFWGARLSLQFFLFDPQPYLTRWFLRVGYYGLHFVFAALVIIYAAAAAL